MGSVADSFDRVRIWPVRASMVVGAVLLLGCAALWPSVASLARYWREVSDYRHGILIAAASIVWLLIVVRRMDEIPLRPKPIAAVPLLIALIAWVIAYKANADLPQQLLFPVILWLAVCAAAGVQVSTSVAAPLAYLFFAMPVWDFLTPVLQWLTVLVTQLVLGAAGIPALVQEWTITIPDGVFAVAEGCSGKRYLVVALALACLAGAKFDLGWRRLLALVGLSAALAMFANWVRVIVIIVAGHVTHMDHYLVRVEHQTFGYELFAGLVITVIWLAGRLASTGARQVTEPVPSHHENDASHSARAVWLPLAILLAAFVFVLAPVAPAAVPPRIGALPVLMEAWQGPLPPSPAWQPVFRGAASELRAAYASSEGGVEVYLNVYGQQLPGRELVQDGNSIVAPMSAIHIDKQMRAVDMDEATIPPAMLLARARTGERWIVAFAYTIGGHLASAPLHAQFWLGTLGLVGGAPSGTLALAARCNGDCERAQQRAIAFWKQQGPALLELIAADWAQSALEPKRTPGSVP